MRHIKVKNGSNKYKLKGDDGTQIGEITIAYSKKKKICSIDITKRGDTLTSLCIGLNLVGWARGG